MGVGGQLATAGENDGDPDLADGVVRATLAALQSTLRCNRATANGLQVALHAKRNTVGTGWTLITSRAARQGWPA